VVTIRGNMRAIGNITARVAERFSGSREKWNPPVLKKFGLVFCNFPYAKVLVAHLSQKTSREPNAQGPHERGLKFQLQFIGKPGHRDHEEVFYCEIADAVLAGFAGHIGLLSTRDIIDAMDALIHFPSTEVFGLVTAKALARNIKFFRAVVGGGMDIAKGAELFAADNFSALQNTLAHWLTAPCPKPQNATALMRSRYHPEVVVRRHLEICREALGRNNE